MFIAGIDGGGTHTRVELRDQDNHFISRTEFGPFNLNSIGEEAFRKLLAEIFTACGGMKDCARLCIGAAGISNPRVKEILEEELANAEFTGLCKLCGDQEIALRGAMDTAGVALIAGTGSISFGKNDAGNCARAGGYGHLIDDGGSGYALGRDVLNAAVRSFDGRCSSSAMESAVYAQLSGTAPQDIVSFVYNPATDKSAIAKFSHIALALAEQKEPVAQEILDRGAQALSELVEAVQRSLSLSGCQIALLGGLLSQDNVYRQTVVSHLSHIGTPIAPAHDALWGAAQIAWELT